MGNIEKMFVLKKLHHLILSEYKGNMDDYAEMLNISRGTLYHYIEELKTVGAEITYCRVSYCYKYINIFQLEINVKVEKK